MALNFLGSNKRRKNQKTKDSKYSGKSKSSSVPKNNLLSVDTTSQQGSRLR